MARDTKPNLTNSFFEQFSGETLTLSGRTEVHGIIEIENGGTLRIDDGNQQVGRVLTSDANGNASWGNAGGTGWSTTGNTDLSGVVTINAETATSLDIIANDDTGVGPPPLRNYTRLRFEPAGNMCMVGSNATTGAGWGVTVGPSVGGVEPNGVKLFSCSNASTELSIRIASGQGILVTDSGSTSRGIQYTDDYSATFLDRSLVDKGYVDSVAGGGLTGATNGLSVSGDDVILGGTLTGGTVINTGDYNVEFTTDFERSTPQGGFTNNVTGTSRTIIGYTSEHGDGMVQSGCSYIELKAGPIVLLADAFTGYTQTPNFGGNITQIGKPNSGTTLLHRTTAYENNTHIYSRQNDICSCIAQGYQTINALTTCDGTVNGGVNLSPNSVSIYSVSGTFGRGLFINNSYMAFRNTCSGGTSCMQSIIINPDVNDSIKIVDNMCSKGLVYDDDYSTSGSTDPRWIPDLAYVTGLTSGGGGLSGSANGLTDDGTNVCLGGTLTQDTLIDTSGYGVRIGTSNSCATGGEAFALGSKSCATGNQSFAGGCNSNASGGASFAWGGSIGTQTCAAGYASTAFASGRAFGTNSFAFGNAVACEASSVAFPNGQAVGISTFAKAGCTGSMIVCGNSSIGFAGGGGSSVIRTGNTSTFLFSGSDNIDLTGSGYTNHMVVPNFAIWNTPQTGVSGDTVLVRDSSTGIIKSVTQSSLGGGGGLSGAGSGLSVSGGTSAILGGALEQATTIETNGNVLNIGYSGAINYVTFNSGDITFNASDICVPLIGDCGAASQPSTLGLNAGGCIVVFDTLSGSTGGTGGGASSITGGTSTLSSDWNINGQGSYAFDIGTAGNAVSYFRSYADTGTIIKNGSGNLCLYTAASGQIQLHQNNSSTIDVLAGGIDLNPYGGGYDSFYFTLNAGTSGTVKLNINGSYGNAGQVLTSDGTNAYWADVSGGTSSGATITGGTFVLEDDLVFSGGTTHGISLISDSIGISGETNGNLNIDMGSTGKIKIGGGLGSSEIVGGSQLLARNPATGYVGYVFSSGLTGGGGGWTTNGVTNLTGNVQIASTNSYCLTFGGAPVQRPYSIYMDTHYATCFTANEKIGFRTLSGASYGICMNAGAGYVSLYGTQCVNIDATCLKFPNITDTTTTPSVETLGVDATGKVVKFNTSAITGGTGGGGGWSTNGSTTLTGNVCICHGDNTLTFGTLATCNNSTVKFNSAQTCFGFGNGSVSNTIFGTNANDRFFMCNITTTTGTHGGVLGLNSSTNQIQNFGEGILDGACVQFTSSYTNICGNGSNNLTLGYGGAPATYFNYINFYGNAVQIYGYNSLYLRGGNNGIYMYAGGSYGTAGDYLTSNGTTVYWKTPASDEALKICANPIENASEMMRIIEPITFEWDRNIWDQGHDGKNFGFSAQNLQKIDSALVTEFDKDGTAYLKIRGNEQILAIIAQAVKEIEARVTALENKE